MIPDGWRYEELNTVITSLEAGVSVNAEDRPKNADEIGVLKVSAVTYGSFDPSAYKTVLPTEVDRLTVFPKRDSVIVSRANTSQLVGASAYIDNDFPDLFLPDKLWQIRTSDDYSTQWLSYVLASDVVRAHMSDRATGTSGSMKNISQDAFLSISILIPPLAEQRKIAAILSTWDEAITLTGQLIAALQRRKQALMQLLLTGAVRFPEFDEEWKVTELRELVEPISRTESVKPEAEYRLIGVRWYVAGVHIHEIRQGSEIITQLLSRVQKNDILYNKMWVTKAAFGIAKEEHEGAYGTSEYPQFLAKPEKLDTGYIEYVFNDPTFQYQATTLCRGTTGRARLNPSDFVRIKIDLPSVSEQKKIASLLQSCDEEIEIYSNYLSGLQSQKRGLMQQLLTGAVRVQV